MEPNILLAITAMAGSAVFMAVGYLNEWAKNRIKCETVEFKVGYAVTTLFIMLAAGMYYMEQDIAVADAEAVFAALATGLAGNAGLSKFISLITNLNQNRKQIDDIIKIADVVGDAITPEAVQPTEQEEPTNTIMQKAKEAGLIKE